MVALCPKRKVKHAIDGQFLWIPAEPTELDLNSIRKEPVLLAAIRLRLNESIALRLDASRSARDFRTNGNRGYGLIANGPGLWSYVQERGA